MIFILEHFQPPSFEELEVDDWLSSELQRVNWPEEWQSVLAHLIRQKSIILDDQRVLRIRRADLLHLIKVTGQYNLNSKRRARDAKMNRTVKALGIENEFVLGKDVVLITGKKLAPKDVQARYLKLEDALFILQHLSKSEIDWSVADEGARVLAHFRASENVDDIDQVIHRLENAGFQQDWLRDWFEEQEELSPNEKSISVRSVLNLLTSASDPMVVSNIKAFLSKKLVEWEGRESGVYGDINLDIGQIFISMNLVAECLIEASTQIPGLQLSFPQQRF